ncbi:MAG: penicillin acylase family protein, partial [Candidatus Bathyarchaeia archaeon]
MIKRKMFRICSVAAFTAMLLILSVNAVAPVKGNNVTNIQFGCELVTIIRDNYGVPHIFALSKEGLAFGCGYAMAQDRLWQADVFRRSAFGNLAELGLATIEEDYEIRKWGYSREELREIYEKWVPTKPEARLKEMMKAYVDGINLYITQAQIKALFGDYSMIPLEYLPGAVAKDGLLPIEPFTIEDCAAITVMMAWRFGGCGGSELQYAAALDALVNKYGPTWGWLIFNDLFPQNDPGAEVTIPSEDGCYTPKCSSSTSFQFNFPSSISQVYQRYKESEEQITELFHSLGIPTKFGSNAWMVSPKKSQSGNALQVGGPQMGQSIP